MGRFLRFLIANLSALGLVGWLQWTLFDVDGLRTTFAQWGARTGLRTHKRVGGRRDRLLSRAAIEPTPPENDPWNG